MATAGFVGRRVAAPAAAPPAPARQRRGMGTGRIAHDPRLAFAVRNAGQAGYAAHARPAGQVGYAGQARHAGQVGYAGEVEYAAHAGYAGPPVERAPAGEPARRPIDTVLDPPTRPYPRRLRAAVPQGSA